MNEEKDTRPVLVKPLTRLQRVGIAVVIVLGILFMGGTVFVWSGVYNISARSDHWTITDWLIATTRDQSIAASAGGVPVPDLGDEDLIALGQEHVRGACLDCHGTPGEGNNPIYGNMLPEPPDLTYAADDYDTQELFWIVHNGMKYTGMPAWPAANRRDEVWAVVAFLEYLNAEGPAAFEPLPASRDIAPDDVTGQAIAPLENCIRCHGGEGGPPISTYIPVLHAQSEDYLARALVEYRDNIRPSGTMEPVAHEMTDAEIDAITAYYAALPPPARDWQFEQSRVSRGEEIAFSGVPEEDVPPCISCHAGTNPEFPLLNGQPADYLAGQMHLWRAGARDASGYGEIMAVIAERLPQEDIEAVSAYFASLAPAPEDGQ